MRSAHPGSQCGDYEKGARHHTSCSTSTTRRSWKDRHNRRRKKPTGRRKKAGFLGCSLGALPTTEGYTESKNSPTEQIPNHTVTLRGRYDGLRAQRGTRGRQREDQGSYWLVRGNVPPGTPGL